MRSWRRRGRRRKPADADNGVTQQLAAGIAIAILLALVFFQLLLAGGAPLGKLAWGGTRRVLDPPLRIASLIAAGIYGVVALVLLEAAGLIDVVAAQDIVRVATWIVAGLFGLGVVMNAISRSPAERMVMTPVALALALLSASVALSQTR